MNIEERINVLLKDTVSDLGFDIVRVKYFDHNRVLQIMIENSGSKNITVDDCELVSNTVSVILDVEDPITSHYNLEISSAGLDRPLVTIDDFRKFKGREVKVQLSELLDGVRKFKGIIEEVVANDVIIRLDTEQKLEIDFNNIISANLTIDTKKLLNKKRSYG